jgi:hypothetical protein
MRGKGEGEEGEEQFFKTERKISIKYKIEGRRIRNRKF